MGKLTDEMRSFLAERRYAVLATHDPDDGIRLAPIWFLFADDRFYFATPSESTKVKNVERDASASVVVDARESGRERWVSASGSADVLRGADARRSTPGSGGGTSRPKPSTARSTRPWPSQMT